MREYDDGSNIQHYAPVLRRIIILVAVITAVPVMLWTITAFMHTYIAQPTISAPRPLATATAAPATPAADTATAISLHRLNPRRRSPTPEQRMTAGAIGYATAPAIMPRRMSKSPLPPLFPRHRPPRPQLPAPAAVTVQAAPAPCRAFSRTRHLVPQPQPTPAAPDPANNAATDALPPPDPITGPVPLPRHRPSVLALADTNIPLPRARPGDAPEPTSQTPDAPPSGYDPGIGH